MNKKELKDIGFALITPNAKKFRFEGVDYQKASKQLMLYGITGQVVLMAVVFVGPVVADKIYNWKQSLKDRHQEK